MSRLRRSTRSTPGYKQFNELSSEVETSETESVQESENNKETEGYQEIKEESPSPSIKPKSKITVQFNPFIVKKIERKPSKLPVFVKNLQQKRHPKTAIDK